MSGGVLRRRVEQVLEIARPAGVAVIVNDRPDVAIAAGADGVHVGPDDLSVADVRRIAGAALLVGASTHDLDEATAAVAAGADYCGVGAMFATETKPDRPPSGPEYLREYLRIFPRVPHLAIGGISPANVGRLAGAGAAGVAVCGAVCRAERPAEVVRALRRALERAGNRPGPA
jgi:thiamine-phosphate pyrophosphorylase